MVVTGAPQAKYLDIQAEKPEFGKNCAKVAGKRVKELAKMMGITPAIFTRSGMWVLCPPYILRPTTLFAYWTGILRCPSVTATTATVATMMPMRSKITAIIDMVPTCTYS
ncbi:hypothetical protein SDC9_175171 [bioreactor metagenome]|uniref:Uncharacterized protein n=1 Tax=bioreactor metagenome TaxID=1076179 RepID=A0A645GLI2_9ZZZZ